MSIFASYFIRLRTHFLGYETMRLSDLDIYQYNTLLLDRDGTINVQLIGDYVKRWEEFEFIPGVLDAMPKLAHHFKYIFIVTNQRGIGKGYFTEKDLTNIHQHMITEIINVGGRIDGIYYSTSLAENDIKRKPGRGMFDEIQKDHPDVELSKTIMIGDDDVDKEFAQNCGIAFYRIDSLKKENGVYKWIKSQ